VVNADSGLNLEYPGVDEISFTELPNSYVGSRTRKLLDLYTINEKLYTASFSTNIPFTRTDNGNEAEASVYSLPSTSYDYVLYSLYMGGDIAETVIDTNRSGLPDVLIYGDSFTNAVECLAYYSFDEMRTIDLRHYTDMSLAITSSFISLMV
jgi:hypothetical protein